MASSGTISSSGIGSGLNVSQIVTALMDAEKGPLNSINKSISTDNAQISAYGSISSQISSFQSAIAGLITPSTIKATTASSSGTSVLSVSNDGTALAGEYKITDVTLASPQVLTSNISTTSYTSINSSIGTTGSITISGTTITPTSYTVAGLVEAINNANISGVSATMTNLGTSAAPDYQIRIVNTSDTAKQLLYPRLIVLRISQASHFQVPMPLLAHSRSMAQQSADQVIPSQILCQV